MFRVFFFFFLTISMARTAAVPLKADDSENQINEDMDVTEIISKANEGIKTPLVHGDIALSKLRNADPCTATGCKWPKTGKYVYIPVYISRSYSTAERNIIINDLVSFHASTCIRFVWRTSTRQRDFLHFYSGSGCWSNLGRQRGAQFVSLRKNGCMHHSIVRHEINHALGSERDLSLSCSVSFRTFIMIPVFLSLLFNSVETVDTSPVVEPAQYPKEFMDIFKSIPQPQADKEPKRYDDIAMPKILKRNADPCTITGCKWFKSGEYVYIPYYIDTNYCATPLLQEVPP